MYIYLLRKIVNNKWLMMSLLIGNILLIGVVVCVPLFTNAIMSRMFIKDMEQSQTENERYPFIVEMQKAVTNKDKLLAYPDFLKQKNTTVPHVLDKYDLPVLAHIESNLVSNAQAKLVDSRSATTHNVKLLSYSGIEDHVTLLAGKLPSDTMVDGIVECMVNEGTHLDKDYLIGDVIDLINSYTKDIAFQMKIVGIFTNSAESNNYWMTDPNYELDRIYMSHTLANDLFIESDSIKYFNMDIRDVVLFDYHEVNVSNLDVLQKTETQLAEEFKVLPGDTTYKSSLSSITEGYIAKSAKLVTTLYVLQVPIYVLLGFFIFMVSKKILQMEQNEISVLQSRGAKSRQIIGIYLLQGFILSAIGFIPGIAVGNLICKIIGSSNGFLDLVQRSALATEITPEIIGHACIAVVILTIIMIVPVFKFSKVTIVHYKSSRMRKKSRAFWQRFYLDYLIFGVSLYALYDYNTQQAALNQKVVSVQSVDPLLFLSTSLFIAGSGLIFIRLFPHIIKLLLSVFRKFWPPSLYASLISIVRSTGEEQFIMIFLVFTLAIGIFDAKTARSINLNSEDKTSYLAGSDYVVLEKWYDNIKTTDSGELIIPDQVVYKEPDFQKYSYIEGVAAVAKVTKRTVDAKFNTGNGEDISFMGIDPAIFSEAVWFRDDLLPIHINNYLNVLTLNPNGVLVSSSLKKNFNLEIGQTISLNDEIDGSFKVTIKGFFDYWPGYRVRDVAYNAQMEPHIAEQPMIVGNNSYYQSLFGVRPYEVWIKMQEGQSGKSLYDYAEANNLLFESFLDTNAEIVESKNDAILQGTNGVLTVGFTVTLLICFFGFLIFWILSIRSRTLQFGIFRAMGMSIGDIYALLVSEQVLVSGAAIAVGTLIGEVASMLFVPLIQVSFSASEQQIPLQIITQQQDYINLYTAVGIIILLCLMILGFIISKLRVAEALKLGED